VILRIFLKELVGNILVIGGAAAKIVYFDGLVDV
jgi:hypothetical protein